ncbi:chemotaxis protein CheA [Pusillimonas sp. CC-YST705]|uniref:Chemotaxis protein CheA n=1 Tax=Mesopusillimonas faecipullorum TaxID=2755040 RepID=A0ABS8C9U2_9BURK|nr:chemotaxis protein CheA [Mesopusillimonas faecipullorum]MCB5362800.1 chemotaxis protein CheA [Mesopusillimonas faecipullorum]
MSSGVDLSQFYETFFDEASELLAEMEGLLLGLDIEAPDGDELNAIFRAAHSIKGGAGTFGCFGLLADTTHLLENLLDAIRNHELVLRREMIDVFLQAKDVLSDQVSAYRVGESPDEAAAHDICSRLRALAQASDAQAVAMPQADLAPAQPSPAESKPGAQFLHIALSRINPRDSEALLAEMALMGDVERHQHGDGTLDIWLHTTASSDDIQAVCCFVVNADQVIVKSAASAARADEPALPSQPSPVGGPAPEPAASSPDPTQGRAPEAAKTKHAKPQKEANTLRVGVEKVDQIINLVGELVITQAMLQQSASTLDPVLHDRLLNGIEHLERNARDLQEAVMSIRMMPMDYVFSRFPRVVRESATRMGKQIHLVTQGSATELDKSLIERIIDPLTHLVRNSIDHGIEAPEARLAAGKPEEGQLTLSAQHMGGQIIIEVSDDGAGLNRQRILDKAMRQGFPVNESTPDDELWQLIFAPGFSTADKVTEISGRGVGMDVVRRNIQSLGGHVLLSSRAGKGTTTRIVLPLTLAILDGMSVQVGEEIFILPLSHVTESMQIDEKHLHRMSNGECVLHVRGEYLPIVAMHKLFDVHGAQTEVLRCIAVILQAEESRFALLVDQLVGQQQVVVKNLEANYRRVPGISAATILGDGSVALIADIFALLRMTRERHQAIAS